MSVIYYDVSNLMALGSARQVGSLDALLTQADFVTLHVPELPETTNMIGEAQFDLMKKGSYLINASRGSVIDIPALINASRSGKLAGAALDVYPSEPAGNGDFFNNDLNSWGKDLRELKNIILTPHIGGSTEEAQSAIGIEVSDSLIRYVNEGITIGAVNMPQVTLRAVTTDELDHIRVIFIHKNVPGVLKKGKPMISCPHEPANPIPVNEILSDHNVEKQMTDSRGEVAYLMADISNVSGKTLQELYDRLEALSGTLSLLMVTFLLINHSTNYDPHTPLI